VSGQDTIYELVTERVIASLEKGNAPWRKPWSATTGGVAVSLSSGKPYRGVNTLLLAIAAEDGGYRSNWWGSYKQVQKLGGNVRKGEASTVVIFWKRLVVEETVDGKKVKKVIPLLRYFRVFNAEQCDGLPEKYQAPAPVTGTFAEKRDAELVLKGYLGRDGAPSVRYGGDRAYYQDGLNHIQLPAREDFHSEDEFYATAYHEITHSTGSPRRLNRPGVANFDHFGSEKYAKEELVAEMGSAILQAVTGIEAPFENSANYVASWLRKLRDDKKLVVQAAAQAQRAVDHILGIEHGDKDADE
jgi:antirestriction protein ArdC